LKISWKGHWYKSVEETEGITLEQLLRFLYNQVWNAGKSGYVVASILLMQKGTISKEIILNKIDLLCTVFYLMS
jgi:hypothetical protein